MTRFRGPVGYADSVESAPGVWTDSITEKVYTGDVIRNSRRLVDAELALQTRNTDISVENSFAIVADAYALKNFIKMRYVGWNGENWAITNVEVRRPRLILTIGGLWNGDTPSAPNSP